MISARTAELALQALASAWRRAKLNGTPPPQAWQVAIAELSAVAEGSPERTLPAAFQRLMTPSEAVEEIAVQEAAARLGITPRAVQRRIGRGSLSARRIGREWLVRWPPIERKEAA
ncbi:helix-turn-helix domain-containing protein [Jiangella rhizosphaerae]|uniref:DNA-binding protein n=1 Tax=Jiangella rhizosphaerae TaxID=2293569 RepID=A0A418KPH3_9ACTN|nr:helix-turn-helix domain-containing protein [Jiangella rhizosphaerae]RIQ21266.1 DNA-binding protein [Jiangella rhizosphaerae]